jgi:hypothetical protein
LERLIATVDLSDDDLAVADADLAAINYYRQFRRALLGERVFDLAVFDHPREAPPGAGSGWRLFREADRAVYLQAMSEIVAASMAKDQPSFRAAMSDIDGRVRKAFESPVASWRYPIAKLLIPSAQMYADNLGRGTAKRDVARTAIAAERFRLAKGRLPEGLNELVPGFLAKVPADPFAGGPLGWAVSGDDCRIYSVGPDGVDQGGGVQETADGGDIVFRLPHRKAGKKSTAAE